MAVSRNALNEALDNYSDGNLPPVQLIGSWANQPNLIDAFVDRYNNAVDQMRTLGHEQVHVVFTAHSIPTESLEFGDFYDEEYDSYADIQAKNVVMKAEHDRFLIDWRCIHR